MAPLVHSVAVRVVINIQEILILKFGWDTGYSENVRCIP
jgi:hypothetical protein